MTEYTSENIFMQNSTSGGVQWEHYIYLKKRKMVSTKFIASLAVLLYIICFYHLCFLETFVLISAFCLICTGQRHRQSSGSLYHLSTLYPD